MDTSRTKIACGKARTAAQVHAPGIVEYPNDFVESKLRRK